MAAVLWIMSRDLQCCPNDYTPGSAHLAAKTPLGTLLLILQREAIRKADGFGPRRLVKFSVLIARTEYLEVT